MVISATHIRPLASKLINTGSRTNGSAATFSIAKLSCSLNAFTASVGDNGCDEGPLTQASYPAP
ncbi:hypothetical protein RM573_00295 [Thalassotalea sp. W431]|uniref:Uncharacterized protein n=1 Tax=Thalassotalea castellviae TaxID=3075612 RepID=A0ABU2ZVR5_9GAMM|nr:hypothetical protein [Thalassotalea sp. W431]MDT0602032.1 hypothetical protein [Thalassotalea sp. W431]